LRLRDEPKIKANKWKKSFNTFMNILSISLYILVRNMREYCRR
jgi:hypothetical protein